MNTAIINGPIPSTNCQYRSVIVKENLSLSSQLIYPNIKYIVKHNFDLNQEEIQLPENCIIAVDGGLLSNGTLIGNDSILIDVNRTGEILDNITQLGTWKEADSLTSISIGTVTSGSEPEVTITGNKSNPILNFVFPKGDKGDKGDTGNGIQQIQLNSDYTLTVTYTNGTTYTTSSIRGEQGIQGEQGVSVSSFQQTEERVTDTLYNIVFSDGNTQSVSIPKGATGPTGETGPTGNGIQNVTLNGDYTLTINYTNGTSYTTSSIRGAQGDSGYSGNIEDLQIVNNLTEGGSAAALSAEMGKELSQSINIKYNNSQSGLDADNVQRALDKFAELADKVKIFESQTILSTLFTWSSSSKYISGTDKAGQELGSEQSSSSPDSKSSGYVDISGFNRIEITLPRFGNATLSPGACFYDENHVAISGMWKAEDTPANTYGTYLFSVPENAKYIRATSRRDFGRFNCIGYTESAINDAVSELDNELEDAAYIAGDKKYIGDSFNWTGGRKKIIIGKDGEAASAYVGNMGNSSSTYSYASDYVDISGYEYIIITLPQLNDASAVVGACFYDENHVPISGVCVAGESPVGMVRHEYKIPSNAKYIRATKRTDSGYGDFLCWVYNTVPISESISKHDVRETDISSDFIFSASKTYVSQIDGLIKTSSSTDSFASSKVNVDNYQRLRVKVPVINTAFSTAGWAFYDGSSNYLCGCAIADEEAESITMVEKTLNVPRNAQYFSVTWRKDNDATFYCYGIEEAQDYSYGEIACAIAGYKEDAHVSVKDFGCIGDGVADDTHAFILALASGVKKLYIPAGTYNIGQTLTIPDGMELCGDGIGKSILHFMKINNNSTGNQSIANAYTPYTWRGYGLYTLIHVAGDNVYLHDFEMEAYEIDTINYQFVGISFYGSENSKMENVSVHDINYRISHGLNPNTRSCHGFNIYIWNNSKNILIDHCIGDNGGYENIGTEDIEDITISNSYWGTGWRTSLQIHRGSKRVRVVNNTINNNNSTIAHASLTIHGISGNPIEDLYIFNNTIHSITDENQGLRGGIELVQSGYQNVFIANNSMDGNSYAIVDLLDDGESASWPNNLFFINNRVKNSRYGICLKRGNNYIVKDNVIDTVNTAIELKATRYICKDNILVDNTTKILSGTEWVDS